MLADLAEVEVKGNGAAVTGTRKHRVYLVDDHPVFRHGIAKLVNSEEDLTVCGEAGTAAAALDGLRQTEADVAILDVSLAGTNGIELSKQIRAEHPKMPLLVVSMHDEALYALRALRAGAQGYVMKREGTTHLLTAIRKVLAGEVWVSPRFSEQLLYQAARVPGPQEKSPLDALTDREMEVLQLLGLGQSTRKIAEELHLSPKTIETHRLHIKEKLGFKQSSELVFFAVNWVSNQTG
ncbi:MAG TPA: response regulator transcription factor [Chthoniobacteraceae bacterium]|jgi:DNA-binding NarL/FixJ family response regulator